MFHVKHLSPRDDHDRQGDDGGPGQGRSRAAGGRGRRRRAQAGRPGRQGHHGGGHCVVAVPALVCIPAALHAGFRHIRRHRGARVSPELRAVSCLRLLPGIEVLAARPHPALRPRPGWGRHRLRALSRRVLSRSGTSAGPADLRRHPRVGGRRRAADRGLAARGRPVDAGDLDHDARLRVRRALSRRPACAQGRLPRPCRLALLAHLRGGVRRRAGCLDELHLPVRAVRSPARQGGRRQLLHSGRVLAARPLPWRARQGRRGVLRHDRHDLGLVRRQRGDGGHLHHSAHEAGRLHAHAGGGDRVRRRRQRPADAAGDGRCRVHHGGIRRHHLRRCGQARHPARASDVWRVVLRGRPGGGEGRHDRSARRAAAQLAAGPHQGRHHHLLRHHPERRHLLGAGLDAPRVRRGGELGRTGVRRCRLRPARRQQGEASGPSAR